MANTADQMKSPLVNGKVVNCGMLRIRKSPTTENENVIGTIKAGTNILVDTSRLIKNIWYKVETKTGLKGFCMSKFINTEE